VVSADERLQTSPDVPSAIILAELDGLVLPVVSVCEIRSHGRPAVEMHELVGAGDGDVILQTKKVEGETHKPMD
jgi:hypothetical protein